MQVCFVNTEQLPKKIRRLGFFKVSGRYIAEMCEVFYPHPDAPEDAIVSVFRFLPIGKMPDAFTSTVEFTAASMVGLQSVTELAEPYEELVTY